MTNRSRLLAVGAGLALVFGAVFYAQCKGREARRAAVDGASPAEGRTEDSAGGTATSQGVGAAAGDSAGKVAPTPPKVLINLKTEAITKSLYRFDVTGSVDQDGLPVRRFVFSFGDGSSELIDQSGRVEHEFPYKEDETELMRYQVRITGFDERGNSDVLVTHVEFNNWVGQQRTKKRLALEVNPCVMAYMPAPRQWSCHTTLRNVHDEPIALSSMGVMIGSPLGADGKPMSRQDLRKAGRVVDLPASPPWPAVLNPGEMVEGDILIADPLIPEGTSGIQLTLVGKGKTSAWPAAASWRAQFGDKRRWMSPEELKQAGAPPVPAGMAPPTNAEDWPVAPPPQ